MGPAQSSWGALGTSSMASCIPHPCVHPILAVLCPRGDAHTLCLHNARIWDTGGRLRDSGNIPWLCLDQAVERAGAAPRRGMTWGHHLGTVSGIHVPAVALFPLLEEPSLAPSVPLW